MAEKKYIPLDAAIEMFEQAFDNNWEVSGTLDRLRAIPAADVVERKNGKWTYLVLSVPGGKGQTYAKWRCSRCRMKFKNRSNYCPNCGADLRENEP